MLAPSDRSRFASYLAVITSYEVIIAGVLNYKVAASRFVNVSAEMVNVVEENTIAKSTKYAIEFDGTLLKAYLHGTTLSHAKSLRQAYDMT